MPSFPIQLKRNGTAAATPSSLLHGEVALNYADGKVFWKDASNVIQSFTFQAYALSSHTHAASDITSGTLDAARIANDSITYAKLQNVSATDRLLGRSSAGAGDVEEISCGSFGRSLIGSADAAAARTVLSVQPTASPAFTGAATVTNDGNVVPLTVTNTGTASSFVVNDASGDTTPFVIDASGNVGIGASPSQRLHIHEPSANDCYARWTNTDTGTSSGLLIGLNGNEQGVIRVEPNKSLFLGANNTDHIQLTGAGQLLVTAGSASACGVAFSGDGNTGLAQTGGADTITVVTDGKERLSVNAGGSVTVMSESASTAASLIIDGGNTGSAGAVLYGRARGVDEWLICSQRGVSGGTALGLAMYVYGAYPMTFWTNNSERMSIASDGVVKMNDVYEDTVGATNRDLFIDSTGKLGYVSSIRASKTGITAIDDVSWLRDLTPVSFHYRRRNEDGTYSDEPDGTLDYGLIAEEVEPVAPELCFYDVVDGEPQLRGVHYSKLITPMLRYIQKLEARIAALEERINA